MVRVHSGTPSLTRLTRLTDHRLLKIKMDKLVAGAVAYREKRGEREWFIAKTPRGEGWEFPKSDVRRGESSVQAIIRYIQEKLGIKVTVLEEAGRVNITITQQGTPLDERIIFYLMRQGESMNGITNGVTIKPDGQWLKYTLARKRLDLVREQKVLSQAKDILKEWQRRKKS